MEKSSIFIYVESGETFSEHTLKSYHDDLDQFNDFLSQEHLELATFEYKDAII